MGILRVVGVWKVLWGGIFMGGEDMVLMLGWKSSRCIDWCLHSIDLREGPTWN